MLARDNHVSPLGVQNFLATLPTTTPKLLVLGNHEYDSWDAPASALPNRSIVALSRPCRMPISSSVNASSSATSRFLGASLWSDFERGQGVDAARFITRTIVADPCELMALHRETMAWLKHKIPVIRKAKRKSVVVTHMAPSYRSLSADERRQPLAGFFASNLESAIRELRPALWIHGHIHRPSNIRSPRQPSWLTRAAIPVRNQHRSHLALKMVLL